MTRSINYFVNFRQITATENFPLPDNWSAFTCVVTGGTATLTGADGESVVLEDGETFSYGSADNAKSFEPITITANAGATVRIAFNN